MRPSRPVLYPRHGSSRVPNLQSLSLLGLGGWTEMKYRFMDVPLLVDITFDLFFVDSQRTHVHDLLRKVQELLVQLPKLERLAFESGYIKASCCFIMKTAVIIVLDLTLLMKEKLFGDQKRRLGPACSRLLRALRSLALDQLWLVGTNALVLGKMVICVLDLDDCGRSENSWKSLEATQCLSS